MERLEAVANVSGVTDIVISPAGAWMATATGFQPIEPWPFQETDHRQLASELIARGGRHVDVATPFADVRLADGIRVHAAVPPISVNGTSISIRLPSTEPPTLRDLVRKDMMDAQLAQEMSRRICAGRSVLVAGATGAGKTTLLAALLAELPHHERIITVEEVAELRIAHPHVVSLQTRQANIEGSGLIDVSQLVRETLRMKPDRLVVGEIRGEEIVTAMLANNSGHSGASTVHCGSWHEVPVRLEALGALAGMTAKTLATHATTAFDDVYFVEVREGCRRVAAHAGLSVSRQGRLRIDLA